MMCIFIQKGTVCNQTWGCCETKAACQMTGSGCFGLHCDLLTRRTLAWWATGLRHKNIKGLDVRSAGVKRVKIITNQVERYTQMPVTAEVWTLMKGRGLHVTAFFFVFGPPSQNQEWHTHTASNGGPLAVPKCHIFQFWSPNPCMQHFITALLTARLPRPLLFPHLVSFCSLIYKILGGWIMLLPCDACLKSTLFLSADSWVLPTS